MNICFYNNFHRGDIHFSRSFVRYAMGVIKRCDPDAKFYYYHPNQSECVSDIPDLTHVNGRVPHHPGDERYGSSFSSDDNNIYINTWIGQDNGNWVRDYGGCTFRGNLDMWERIMQAIYEFYGQPVVKFPDRTDVSDNPPHTKYNKCDEFLPEIDYSKYTTINVDDHMNNTKGKFRKRIFVSNGMVLSGQAMNFDFDPMIETIAGALPDVAFYMTNTNKVNKQNVFSTAEIIKASHCDLNENAYLSRFCDVIIGRASGPWSFALTRENVQDPNKTWFAFTNSYREGFWHYEGAGNYEWYGGCVEHIIQQKIAAVCS